MMPAKFQPSATGILLMRIPTKELVYCWLFLSLISCPSLGFGQQRFRMFSAEVQDSFDIYLNAGHLDKDHPIRYIYYLDAEIKSGKELRRQLAAVPDALLQNKVFIGIGHTGNFHRQRIRDFLPPSARFEQAHSNRFYDFLQRELIPAMESRYGIASGRSLIGHSFGGLFVCYSLFRPDRLFDSYFALSPSLWVDNYKILGTERSYFKQTNHLPAFLYLSCGSGETMNHIIYGNRRLKTILTLQHYEGLQLIYQEHPGRTHNSQVPLSMHFILHHNYQ